ncbi:MAG: asparagine synthase (glutamine-hydrolyzing) [Planctomycetota bacterium]
MCGIAGVLRIHDPGAEPPPHHESIPASWLDVLDDSIKHRGPDGAGRFRDRAVRPDGSTVDVALVHRRLSIIDHEFGHQPMVSIRGADGGVHPPSLQGGEGLPRSEAPPSSPYLPMADGPLPIPVYDATGLTPSTDLIAVSFNGCIYNHRELRQELESLGHAFKTDHSDTEVLIHGWREWGLHMQDHLDGMYAFLLWDRRHTQLAWGRDLVGEKPLYSSRWDGTRVFASTANAIATMHQVRTPDEPVADTWTSEWLRFGAESVPPIDAHESNPAEWIVTPKDPPRGGTIPRKIGALDPVIAVRRIGHIARGSRGNKLSFENRASELIERAVTSRLDADVPLGVFLSGGLDSALIVAIAHKHRPDLRAFTVRMPHPDYDESVEAVETAAAIGVEHTILDCDPHPADDLVKLIQELGLPFGDSSLLPTYWVSRAAREYIKVALSGDGGDELFGGYRRHTIAPMLARWRHALRLIPTSFLDKRTPGSKTTYLARLAIAARFGGYPELLAIFPTPDLTRLIPSVKMFAAEDVDDPLTHDFNAYLPNDLLRKTDTASMSVGLEVRAPFLARELVDAALRTPLDVLMPPRNGQPERKGLLKCIARAYLPDHVIDRPKQGFAIPIGDWFRTDYGGMRSLLHDHLRSAEPFPGLADVGVEINMRFVEKMLDEHDAAGENSLNPWHGRDHSQRLYMLLVLSIWARWLSQIAPAPPPRGAGDRPGRVRLDPETPESRSSDP